MRSNAGGERIRAGRWAAVRIGLCLGLVLSAETVVRAAGAQVGFAVATIRPSAAAVQFEHDGKTETSPGTLRMRDVTVNTCIKWAYSLQDSQIVGPGWMQQDHFDISAKADGPVGDEQMKRMLQALLADRFRLVFHRDQKELKSLALTVAKSGAKLKQAADGGTPFRQNSANGMVAKSITMQEFADFISGPLQIPVVDKTGLPGRYDFTLDFTSYLPDDMETMRPDPTTVIMAALQGELGLRLEPRKEQVEVMVVDHVERPSEN
jgi:uncharacterized protein (TIGR03435 family)